MLFSRRQSEEEKTIALCYDYAAKVLTEINSIAEEAVLRYGVRYSSTLPLLPVHYATSASFCTQTSIPKTPTPEDNKC